MPTNLYGPNDNFNLETSHVLPALIRRFHEAKTANLKKEVIWGTGKSLREFLHVDDLVDACLYIMNLNEMEFDQILNSSPPIINIGSGKEISIQNLVELICGIVGYKGIIENDLTKPDGTPRKLLDVSKISDMGWEPKIPLKTGILMTYEWYLKAGPDRLMNEGTHSRDRRI